MAFAMLPGTVIAGAAMLPAMGLPMDAPGREPADNAKPIIHFNGDGLILSPEDYAQLLGRLTSRDGLVADSYSVVILSNKPAWRFRVLSELSEQARAELVEVRKYAEQALQPLPSSLRRQIDNDSQWRRVEGPDGPRDYLWQRLALEGEGWTLHLLLEPQTLVDSVRSYRLAAAGVWMTLAFLLLFLAQRRKNQRLQAGIRERLEREVALRTAELREAQDGLVHAAKMAALGQMSAALAHEINQPLTALQMQLGSLRLLAGSGRPEAVRDGLQRIDGLLQRMAALTGHLKTFARKTPAGLSERLCLGDVLEQALQLLAPRMRSEQVELRTQIDDEAEVLGDAIRIEQVILNLLHNALDAMADSEPRILLVRIAREDDGCLLSVEDSGGGIAEETLGRVFEPFFTTKPVGQGTGLGMPVVHGILRDHQGAIQVRSILGTGSLFRVYLRGVEGAERQTEVDSSLMGLHAPGDPADGTRILYVDDDELIARMVGRMLDRDGLVAHIYSSPQVALDAVQRGAVSYDLAVLDFAMPGMNGLELARALRRLHPDRPVAITSGFITTELSQKGPEAGVAELIPKPNTGTELIKAIRRLAGRTRQP